MATNPTIQDLYKKDILPTNPFNPNTNVGQPGLNNPLNTVPNVGSGNPAEFYKKKAPIDIPIGTPPTIPTYDPYKTFGGPYNTTANRTGLFNPFDDVLKQSEANKNVMTSETGPVPTPYQPVQLGQKVNLNATAPYTPGGTPQLTVPQSQQGKNLMDFGIPTLKEDAEKRGFTEIDQTPGQPTPVITPDRPEQMLETKPIYQPGPDPLDPDPFRDQPTSPTPGDPLGPQGDPEIDKLVKEKTISGVTGDDSEIQALTQNHERDVARLSADGLAEARAIAASRGYMPGSEQYNQVMRSAQQQINEATLSSQRNLYGTIRQKREKALENLRTLGDNLWGRGNDLWARKSESERNTAAEMTKLINSIPHQAIRNVLLTFGNDVDGAIEWLKLVIKPNGRPADRFVDSDFEIMQRKVGDLLRGQNPQVADKYTDANNNFDEEGFIKDPAIQSKLADKMTKVWEAEFGPHETAAQDRELKESVEADVNAILNKQKTLQDLTPQQWGAMNDNQLSQLNIPVFNPSASKFLRITDFVLSRQKADVVESSRNDGEHVYNENSAGAGQGDIVLVNGKPYRLTRFWSKLDTTGKDERIGRLYGVPADGSSTVEKELSRAG